MSKSKLAKRNHLVLRVLVFLSLVVSACCLVISFGGIARQPAAQTLPLQNNASQVSPETKTEQNAVFTPIPTPQTPIADTKPEIPEPDQPIKTFLPPTQYQGKLVRNVKLSSQEKVVALTFDDGPWPQYTSQVLKILKKDDIKATFFVIGRILKVYPEIAKEVVAEGHAIANHTWSHSYRWMNKAAAAREIDDTADLIYKTTGVKSLYFRPPGGILTNGVADYAKQKNYSIIMWSNDSIDYRPSSAMRLVNNVMGRIKQTEIILMHDGGGNRSSTVRALPEIISRLKKLGYRFVTIPELLEMELKQKAPASKSNPQTVNSQKKDLKTKHSDSSPGMEIQEDSPNASPLLPSSLNNEEKGIKSEEKDPASSSITPNPESSPGDLMQEIPDTQSPFPSPYSSTEQ